MRKQCAETYKKQCRMITYCLHQMLILQHASLFQICHAVTISSEIKPLPFHTVAPNLHEKRCPSRSSYPLQPSSIRPFRISSVNSPLSISPASAFSFLFLLFSPSPFQFNLQKRDDFSSRFSGFLLMVGTHQLF